MMVTRQSFLILVSVVLFLVLFVLALVDAAVSAKTHELLLAGGLAAFAAGHLA